MDKDDRWFYKLIFRTVEKTNELSNAERIQVRRTIDEVVELAISSGKYRNKPQAQGDIQDVVYRRLC